MKSIKTCLVITNHNSQKIRPYGRDLFENAYASFKAFCKHDCEIIIVDNQSDTNLSKINHPFLKDSKTHYFYVEDQWKKGLTGAWNLGIKKAYELGCDVILNSNDDLIFNESINSFIEKIDSHLQSNLSIFGPLTNGVNGPFVEIQGASKADPNKTREIVGKDWEGFISGFFLGFTKNFYEKYRYSDGDLFAEFEKFSKEYIHKYAGDCGKWGGQEMEILRFRENGGKVFVIGECWIDHIKKRDWNKARNLAGEYGWHLKEKF